MSGIPGIPVVHGREDVKLVHRMIPIPVGRLGFTVETEITRDTVMLTVHGAAHCEVRCDGVFAPWVEETLRGWFALAWSAFHEETGACSPGGVCASATGVRGDAIDEVAATLVRIHTSPVSVIPRYVLSLLPGPVAGARPYDRLLGAVEQLDPLAWLEIVDQPRGFRRDPADLLDIIHARAPSHDG